MQSTGLRYFLEVARSGSIADASVRLNVAGSAISRQIAKLERELGVELFERRPRGMVPSAAGEVLAAHARRTTLDAERVITDIRELQGPHRGFVRLASYEGFAVDILPEAIAKFRREYPGVRFHLWVGSSIEIVRLIHDGEADIGTTFNYAPPRGVKIEQIIRRPMHALIPRHHPLAGHMSVTMAETLPYAVALPDKDRTQRHLIDTAFAMQGLTIDPVLSTNSISALRRFADAEGCIHFSSAIRVPGRVEVGEYIAIPVSDDVMTDSVLQILTMEGRVLPAVVQTFLNQLLTDISITHQK
ncbi:LysR family transcriptional regulator [Phyllobacterium myrsinacearum]|uniref:DNA-binding transcriptional LysR family regulator n=1 Tax=Phyllobacterium myrsinacearum TaxID=28101 RepID=A0A839EHE6_9HYPH|nr:LysR family transcriptional regulator [Phyllobacterium myrsinacearum]MBA8879693.1 DNA-binding transcriptional LysR family regulator [Phyllobacterium myrsinacearum]